MYNIKQLLGQQKALHVNTALSWQAVQSMSQSGNYQIVHQESQRAMNRQLAEILCISYTETPGEQGLELSAKIYVFTPEEILELLGQAYELGTQAVRSRPVYSVREKL